ncbi:MAG TPA: hypothetical protein VK453_12080 [Micromonosporaceae bacterium]|nr:hypothetical protein [Micromonosporaceae bacterium]
MSGWIEDLLATMIDGVLNWLTSGTMAALNWVLGLLSETVFTSPDVTALPQVGYMSDRALLAANASLALIVTVVGFLAMTHGTVQNRHSLKELLPRMLIGFVAANLSTPILTTSITGANALTAGLAGGQFTSQDSFNQIKRVIAGVSSSPEQFVVALILQLLVVWLLVLLVITWLGRLAVLLVVGATAPVALLCHSLPQTDPVARVWWRTLGGCLAIQILQAVTLHMAVATLLSSDAALPALGLPKDPTGLFNLLVTCLLLWLVIRIPRWVARTFGGNAGRGGSMLGSIVRLVVVQQVLGAMGLRGGRRLLGRGPAAGAPGIRPPATHFHQHANTHQHVHLHPPRDGQRPGTARSGEAGSRQPWPEGRPARPHPGRPPAALEGRPAVRSRKPRPAIGSAPSSR